jgi:DNA mismatch repair protein MutS2
VEGVVTALGETDAEIQVGTLRIRAKLSDLQKKSTHEATDEVPQTTISREPSVAGIQSPGLELNLRGQTSEEALEALERYLEQAYSAGLPYVRIIHGKGTGKLRRVVREALRQNTHVSSFEDGGPKEGGEGVTVVNIHS